jgi:integral membrane sensor domain MASE1
VVWPPTGIAIAILWLGGYRYWPAIWLGALLANATTHESLLVAAGLATGDTLEAVLAVYLLRRFKFRDAFNRFRDVAKFIVLAAAFSTLVAATIGTVGLILGGNTSWAHFGSVWSTWWLGDMNGALIFAPVILALRHRPVRLKSSNQIMEFGLILGAVLIAAILIFSNDHPIGSLKPLAYMMFPFMVLMAMRFDVLGATIANLAVMAVATWGTSGEVGPFGVGLPPEQGLIRLQIYMLVTAITTLLLGAEVAQRRNLEHSLRGVADELKQSRDELERNFGFTARNLSVS